LTHRPRTGADRLGLDSGLAVIGGLRDVEVGAPVTMAVEKGPGGGARTRRRRIPATDVYAPGSVARSVARHRSRSGWSRPFVSGSSSRRASRRAGDRENPLRFDVAPAHFVERHGLVVIVAIGESIVAVGIGAAGVDVDLELVSAAILGLAVSAGLWWAYFGDDDEVAAQRALDACEPVERQWTALRAFGLPHFLLLFGIVLTACGLEIVIAHRRDELELAQAFALAGGVTIYLFADGWFRHVLGLGRSAWRVAVGALVLATLPLGLGIAALAQLGAVAGALIVMLVVEARKASTVSSRR
jgi:hypothetical protein